MTRLARPLAVAAALAATAVAVFAQEAAKPAADAAAAKPFTAGTFKIDGVHSSAFFRISHMSTGAVYGLVPAPTGTVEQDAKGPTKFDVTLEIDKINTGNEKRDQHLKNADFFNAKQFPQMTFKSTSVEPVHGDTFTVTGDLTIKGKTKRISVAISRIGEGKGMKPDELRVGYETSFEIDRNEFGIDYGKGMLGDTVDVGIAFVSVKN